MIFYVKDFLSQEIDKESAAHFFSMRVKTFDILNISDLKGCLKKIKIVAIDKKTRKIEYEILDQKNLEKPPQRILYQSILEKNYLEKLVEIAPHSNLTKIVLFDSEFSLKQNINLDRLEKILIRSCEQSENAFLPKIEFLSFDKVLEQANPDNFLVLEKNSKNSFKDFLLNVSNPFDYNVLVGPEGGFSKSEIDIFVSKKINFLELGKVVYPGWLAGFVFFSQQI